MLQVCIIEGRICRRRRWFAFRPVTMESTGERVWLEPIDAWELMDLQGRWRPWCFAAPDDVVPPIASGSIPGRMVRR